LRLLIFHIIISSSFHYLSSLHGLSHCSSTTYRFILMLLPMRCRCDDAPQLMLPPRDDADVRRSA